MKPMTCREAILHAMSDGEAKTINQIAQETGIAAPTVKTTVQGMHRRTESKPREIYIADWISNGQGKKATALWELGDEEDAERSTRKPSEERRVMQSLRDAYKAVTQWDPFFTSKWNVAQVSGERG